MKIVWWKISIFYQINENTSCEYFILSGTATTSTFSLVKIDVISFFVCFPDSTLEECNFESGPLPLWARKQGKKVRNFSKFSFLGFSICSLTIFSIHVLDQIISYYVSCIILLEVCVLTEILQLILDCINMSWKPVELKNTMV